MTQDEPSVAQPLHTPRRLLPRIFSQHPAEFAAQPAAGDLLNNRTAAEGAPWRPCSRTAVSVLYES